MCCTVGFIATRWLVRLMLVSASKSDLPEALQVHPFLGTALLAAEAASEIILKYWHSSVDVDYKGDGSPVTRADTEAEAAILRHLQTAFPEHGYYAEETGSHNRQADYLWLIDPLDGTKSFVRGTPYFSTQIALSYRGEIILGVSKAPVFEQTLYAVKDFGAWENGKRLYCSEIADLSSAALSLGNVQTLAASSQSWASLAELITCVNRIRGYGDFQHYHLLAKSGLDLVIESDVNILDIAALSLIVQEAGGVMTNLHGGQIDLQTRSILAAANTALHQQVLERLQSVPLQYA